VVNVNELISECLYDLEKGDTSLTSILNRCLRIAYTLKDYEAILAIRLELKGLDDKETMNEIRQEFFSSMMKKYNNLELVKKIYTKVTEQFLARRSVIALDERGNIKKEKMIKMGSISEIENEINRLNSELDRNVIPDGLHPLDLYYEKEKKDKVNDILLHAVTELQNIISRVKNFAYNYLIKLESQGVEKGVFGMGSNNTNKNVFIIHGHNEAKWRELYQILKEDFGLNPIVLSQQPDRGCTTLIEKFEYYAKPCSYAFAIFTPDDVVENNGKKYFQARPNVIYELGWFTAYLGRERVSLLLQEGENMEIFSDFQGVIQKRFKNTVSEKYKEIKADLEFVGLI
jgi:predicted nucleotide-binding protein